MQNNNARYTHNTRHSHMQHKYIFNMSDDKFWLLVKDLCGWAHIVTVFEGGERVFRKDEPAWGKGMFESIRSMTHYLKLQKIKEQLPSKPRWQRRS